MLWQFVLILAVHWLADFILQSHWMASNKSKDNWALTQHVATYTVAMSAFAPLILLDQPYLLIAVWIAVNGTAHWVTDYFTSRWSGKHFAKAINHTVAVLNYQRSYGEMPDDVQLRLMEVEPGRHWHNFFVIIGLDQLIHQVTLFGTMMLIFGRPW